MMVCWSKLSDTNIDDPKNQYSPLLFLRLQRRFVDDLQVKKPSWSWV